MSWRLTALGARRRAMRSATVLDELVERHSALLPSLSESRRVAAADYLAELAQLADAYRYYARGWIRRAELQRRGGVALTRLGQTGSAQRAGRALPAR